MVLAGVRQEHPARLRTPDAARLLGDDHLFTDPAVGTIVTGPFLVTCRAEVRDQLAPLCISRSDAVSIVVMLFRGCWTAREKRSGILNFSAHVDHKLDNGW